MSLTSKKNDKSSTVDKMKEAIHSFADRLGRTKMIDTTVMDTNLRRCLTTADITFLGIGHMVGSGVYVLAATVSKNIAGPAIVLAFIISGIASFLAALCYAELGVRFPKAGSAYSYTYLALGELWAFLVGWNVALENVIGVAAISRACSAYIDSLAGGVIQNATESFIGPIHSDLFSERLDFLALVIVIFFVAFLSFGVRVTSQLNNVFSVVNICVIVLIIAVGAYYSDIHNWTNPDTGGFMPFGFSGVLAASASCFYAYVGFDAVAASGEEAKDPQKSIPLATMMCMGAATLAYVGVSSVLTLMVNYKDIANDSGLPEALASHGATWAKIIVIIGALCGMATGLICTIFALTRGIYAMADDGLLFKLFSIVHEKTKIPLIAMYSFALLAAILSFSLDITTLVEVMSIGTLFAYLVVSASVIIIRYRPITKVGQGVSSQELSSVGSSSPVADMSPDIVGEVGGQLRERFYILNHYIRMEPGQLVMVSVFVMTIFMFATGFFVKVFIVGIQEGSWWAVLVLVFLCFGIATTFGIILLHEQSPAPSRYKVPIVPLTPALSIFVNIFLITNLRGATWIRLIVWVVIGLCLYFFYGLRHSKLGVTLTSKSSLLDKGSCPPQTWGTLGKEYELPGKTLAGISDKKDTTPVHGSTSTEILVESDEKSP